MVKTNKEDVGLGELLNSPHELKEHIRNILDSLHIDTRILDFDPEVKGIAFEQQPAYQLWHLLYSYEGDDSKSGNETLYHILEKKFGFTREYAQVMGQITLINDYGNLSSKAIRKMIPHIKELQYNEAAAAAGYRHSKHSLTRTLWAS